MNKNEKIAIQDLISEIGNCIGINDLIGIQHRINLLFDYTEGKAKIEEVGDDCYFLPLKGDE